MRELTRLDVHWGRLARNWERVQKLAPGARILPMVKANAYGHGLVPVGQYLHDQLGAQTLGVATLGEAEALVAGLTVKGAVYVFSEVDLHAPQRYSGKNIWPVLSNFGDLKLFLRSPAFSHLPLIVKLNTGMNRLGLDEGEWEEAGRLILQSGRKSIHHLLSHYACSYYELKAGDKTHRQAEAFERGLKLFRAQGLSVAETSLANSGAIEQKFSVDQTWVRPGLMLYGPASFSFPGEVISDLVTRAIKVFEVKKGTPVGYGVNVAAEDGVIAVVPMGYGDGLPTQAAGHRFEHQGFAAKIFGRVNMDMAFILFPTSALGKVNVGDEIRLWDARQASVDTLAQAMHTHAYQTMCAISGRVPRIYHLE